MKKGNPIKILRHLFIERKIIAPLILFMIGYFIVFFPHIVNMEDFIKEKGAKFFGYLFFGIGTIWIYAEMIAAYFIHKTNDSFSEVDARRRGRENIEVSNIVNEIKELKDSQEAIDYDKIENLVKEASSR